MKLSVYLSINALIYHSIPPMALHEHRASTCISHYSQLLTPLCIFFINNLDCCYNGFIREIFIPCYFRSVKISYGTKIIEVRNQKFYLNIYTYTKLSNIFLDITLNRLNVMKIYMYSLYVYISRRLQ